MKRTTKPFFSIIIPVYNTDEEYLTECMLSIYHQTFKDYEIIIVDDGSIERIGKACDHFCTKYPQLLIKCIHQENSGQIAARMNGFKHSCGEYIMFIDADDTLESNALEVIYNTFEKHQCDIVMFNALRDNGTSLVPFWNHYREEETILAGKKLSEFLTDAITTNRLNNLWLKSFKRSIIEAAPSYKNASFIRVCEDYLMQLPYYDSAKSVVYIPKYLYRYRLNLSGVCASSIKSFNPDSFESALLLFRERKKYALRWHIKDGEYHANRRFFNDVSSSVKQLKYAINMEKREKILFLKKVARNDTFRAEYEHFVGADCDSQIGRIVCFLLYHRMYNLALFVINHDPKIHGENTLK